MKVGVYARLSQDREDTGDGKVKENGSVDRQIRDCKSEAKRRHWTVADVYSDNNVSAFDKRKKRPEFERLLADLEAGIIESIICAHIDRLARQPRDLERVIDLIEAKPSVVVAFVSGDTLNRDNTSMARIGVTIANQASKDTGRRVRRAHLAKAERGEHMGPRPYGWNDDGTLNPAEAPQMQAAVEEIISGVTGLGSMSERWNTAGYRTIYGKRWRRSSLRATLESPRMAGWRVRFREIMVNDDGEQVRGLWEPMISEEDWQRLRAILALNKRPGVRRSYLLTALLTCGKCGALLKGSYSSPKSGHSYTCPWVGDGGCGGLGISGPRVDDYVTEVVLTTLRQVRASESSKQQSWSGEADLSEVQQRLLALADQFADGDVDAPMFKRASARLRDRKLALEADRGRFLTAQQVRSVPADAVDRWDDLTLLERRGLVQAAAAAIVVRPSLLPRGRWSSDRVEFVPHPRS